MTSSDHENMPCDKRLCSSVNVELPEVLQSHPSNLVNESILIDENISFPQEQKGIQQKVDAKELLMRRSNMEENAHVVYRENEGLSIEAMLKQAERYACSSLEIGSSTTAKLCEQGNQIRLITSTVDETEYELKKSHRIVRGISSWIGAIKNVFTKSPKPPSRSTHYNKEYYRSSSPVITSERKERASEQLQINNGSKHPTEKALKSTLQQVESKEMQKNTSLNNGLTKKVSYHKEMLQSQKKQSNLIDLLHEDVHRLHEQAVVQNEILTEQNAELENLNNRNEAVRARIDKTQHSIRDLL